MPDSYHKPVMADEILEYLSPRPGQTFVDATFGGGGHAARIADKIAPDGTLVVLDQDTEALEAGSLALASSRVHLIPVHANFASIREELVRLGIGGVNGVLFDLGVSSHQLDAGERGFSFRIDAPIDMRMNGSEGETGAEYLAGVSEKELLRILTEYGEERWAVRIAKFIVEARQKSPIETTLQLAAIVDKAVPKGAQPKEIHVATRTFQAIRIAVNQELESLESGLEGAVESLEEGGSVAVLSYHSLEDRIVKQMFQRMAGKCICPREMPMCGCNPVKRVEVVTRKPVLPSSAEIAQNSRARSAKLRVARKV